MPKEFSCPDREPDYENQVSIDGDSISYTFRWWKEGKKEVYQLEGNVPSRGIVHNLVTFYECEMARTSYEYGKQLAGLKK